MIGSMEGLRPRYQGSQFFKEVLFFFIGDFLSCFTYLKSFLFCQRFSYHKRKIYVYPSLNFADIPSPWILESGLGLASKIDEKHDQICKPCERKSDVKPIAHSPIFTSFQLRYKPLKLPPFFHGFPLEYHRYLPIFDGEEGGLTSKTHLILLSISLTSLRSSTMLYA